jgi:transcriptional regulator with XRE-family HTH domain
MTSRRDRLRAELQRHRMRAGLSGRALADKVGVKQATISRVERGHTLPSIKMVNAWLAAVGADEGDRARLRELAEAVHGETRGWGELLGDAGHNQDEARLRETETVLARNFQPSVVPGLLQTPEYARAVLRIGRTTNVESAVATRIERQQALYDEGRTFHFLIAEQVLHWPVGGHEVLAAQRDRLVSLARLRSVELAVVPAGATVLVPWHNFVVWDTADGGRYVTTELFHGAQEVTAAESVDLYVEVWERLWAAAAHGSEAVELIRGLT